MLIATIATLLIQSAGTIAWDTPVAPDPGTPVQPMQPVSTLPDWAKADPYGWERSQCSPMVRRDVSMEACQVRVRTDLAAALGGRLPGDLAPDGIEGCRQVSDGRGGYVTSCAPVQRTLATSAAPVAEICEERPTRTANGVVAFGRECRPATGAATKEGLSFRLGGD